jgi:cell division protein FtsB
MMGVMRKGSRAAGRSSRSRGASAPGREAVATLSRPSLALLLLVAGLLLASAFVAIEVQRSALARQAAVYRADIAAAQATNSKLAADVAAKKTDDYVVNKARDYGFVLPGETLIGVQQEAPAPVAVINAPSASHVQKWLALFFGAR